MTEPGIDVTVVWAGPDVQEIVALTLAAGASLADAVAASGLLDRHAVDRAAIRFGIHGRLRPETTVLAAGDRVEIYRPLAIEPKAARHLRANVKAARSGR